MCDLPKGMILLLGPKNPLGKDAWVILDAQSRCHDWGIAPPKVFRAESRRFTATGERSRPVSVLRPDDAALVYRKIHSDAILIVTQSQVHVLLDPRRDPATERTVAKSSAVLRHKAHVLVAGDQATLKAQFDQISSPHACHVSELHDPRVLPLHVFDVPDREGRLDETSGRRKFIRAHRVGRTWQSDRGSWQDAETGARHGRDRTSESCSVSGLVLPSGFHWDAQATRNGNELIGLDCVWKISRRGYANVFPTGAISGGQRSSRVWPR
jgi:hypothetical protein